jgi:hypothetical protein
LPKELSANRFLPCSDVENLSAILSGPTVTISVR